ncbi:sel1 repeat family protein [Rhodoblastus acidophilus]|nr:sel1 repeat family protein [Rhodoblastus acidophilus]
MGNYQAYAEYKMGHYDAARHVWEVLAERGNPDALFNLGSLAEDGLGEAKDMAKAESLYVAGADAGGFKAQYRLGMLYSGAGPLRNIDKARHYLSLAAQEGDRDAIERLASLAHPDKPPSDFERAEMLASGGKPDEAAPIYRRLADGGDRHAQTRLAWLYESGKGVERDLAEAGRRFLIAGEAGDAEAQYALAVMFKTGKGQAQDDEQSRKWLERSAAQKYPAALAALAAAKSEN